VSSSSVIEVTCVVGAKGIIKDDLGVLEGVCDITQGITYRTFQKNLILVGIVKLPLEYIF